MGLNPPDMSGVAPLKGGIEFSYLYVGERFIPEPGEKHHITP